LVARFSAVSGAGWLLISNKNRNGTSVQIHELMFRFQLFNYLALYLTILLTFEIFPEAVTDVSDS
jgi:hypothetical protein